MFSIKNISILLCFLLLGCQSNPSVPESEGKITEPHVLDEETLEEPGSLLPVTVEIPSMEKTLTMSGHWRVYDTDSQVMFSSSKTGLPSVNLPKKYKVYDENPDTSLRCFWKKNTCKLDLGQRRYTVFISGYLKEEHKAELELFLEKLSQCTESSCSLI